MSWTHPICERCWIERESAGDGDALTIRRPVKLLHPTLETCCFCKSYTIVGIYVREDPAGLPCGGAHE